MNYEKAYNQLCSSRKSRRLQKEVGYEIHHIVPTSLGGSNESSNLVKLTCREHYLAHWLLYKIYKNAPMAAAWKFMCEGNDKQNAKSKIVTSRRYERARIAHSKSLRGNTPWNKGRKEDPTVTAKRAAALKGSTHPNRSIGNWLARPHIWGKAKEAYDLWHSSHKASHVYNTLGLTRHNVTGMLLKFKKGWNPHICQHYKQFEQTIANRTN